jgi:hypothetical protein
MSCHRQPVRKHVQDPRDDLPVLYPRAAHVPVGRPEGLDPLPLLVREFASRHAFSTATDVEVVKPVLPHQHFRQRRGWRVHRRHPRSRSLLSLRGYRGGGPARGTDRQSRLDRSSSCRRAPHSRAPLPPYIDRQGTTGRAALGGLSYGGHDPSRGSCPSAPRICPVKVAGRALRPAGHRAARMPESWRGRMRRRRG